MCILYIYCNVESIYSIFSFKYENNIMGLLSWSCACTYKSAEEQSFVFKMDTPFFSSTFYVFVMYYLM